MLTGRKKAPTILKNVTGIHLLPANDAERINALHRYRILDTPSEAIFDKILALACQMFNTPAGLISLVDKDRVFFKANYKDGFTYSEREKNICSFVVLEGNTVVIEDASVDPRTKNNPAVTGSAHIRFYAGAPLKSRDGHTLGTLCIVDLEPRSVDTHSLKLLNDLASMVMDHMEGRLWAIEKDERQGVIEQLNQELQQTNARLSESVMQLKEAQLVQSSLLEQIQVSETQLLQAVQSGNMGTWSIDTGSNTIRLSALGRDILGFTSDRTVQIDDMLQIINAAYRPQITNILQQALAVSEDIDITFTITHPISKQERWVRITGKPLTGRQNKRYSFSGMLMDITAQKQDEQRKNDFIGMVSHELKTPLTSISGYLQFLEMRTKEIQDHFTNGVLQKANKQVGKMTTMINGFLNLSRLESGKLEIDKTYFDMAALVSEIAEETLSVTNSHKIVFAPVAPIYVNADRDKIGYVISNFISNAIKYSPAATTIKVYCMAVNGTVQVSVTDEGIGIKETDIPRLFERYFRVGGNANISGFGIGLYLCKEIIDLHNGYIDVDSEFGKGSTFSFTLQLDAPDA